MVTKGFRSILSFVLMIAIFSSFILSAYAESDWTCPDCGAENDASFLFCPKCGYSREDTEVDGKLNPSDNFEIPIHQQLGSYDGVIITANRIYVPNTGYNENLNYNVEVQIQNNGNNPYEVNDCSVRIDGFTFDSNVYERVDSGKKLTVNIAIDQDRLSYTDVKSYDSIEINVGLYNPDSYEKAFETGYIYIDLSQTINIQPKTAANVVLYEDNCIRITLLGVSMNSTIIKPDNTPIKACYFYLLKENFSDISNLRFHLDIEGHYANDEVTIYSCESCCGRLPEHGKEISLIKTFIPDGKRINEFEYRVIAQMGLNEFLNGNYFITTDEEDNLVSASGEFKQAQYYYKYEEQTKDVVNPYETSEAGNSSSGNSDSIFYYSEDGNTMTYMQNGQTLRFERDAKFQNNFVVYMSDIHNFLSNIGTCNLDGIFVINFKEPVENCTGYILSYCVVPDDSDSMENATWALINFGDEELSDQTKMHGKKIPMVFGNVQNNKWPNTICYYGKDLFSLYGFGIYCTDTLGGYSVGYQVEGFVFEDGKDLAMFLHSYL